MKRPHVKATKPKSDPVLGRGAHFGEVVLVGGQFRVRGVKGGPHDYPTSAEALDHLERLQVEYLRAREDVTFHDLLTLPSKREANTTWVITSGIGLPNLRRFTVAVADGQIRGTLPFGARDMQDVKWEPRDWLWEDRPERWLPYDQGLWDRWEACVTHIDQTAALLVRTLLDTSAAAETVTLLADLHQLAEQATRQHLEPR